MGEPSEIRVNLPFRGRQLAEFLAIKEHLGIQTNADVVRYLVHRHARMLQRREEFTTQRRKDAKAQRRKGTETQRGNGAEAQRGDAPEEPVLSAPKELRRGGRRPLTRESRHASQFLCLDCPLPECDEGDPRCPYQRATGEREQQRERKREHMRRVRAR